MMIFEIILIFLGIVQCELGECWENEPACGDYDDTFQILGHDYIEFYVSNAKQALFWWQTTLGFTPISFRDLSTGELARGSNSASYVLRQGKITVKLTSPLRPDGPINDLIDRHGDHAIHAIALTVVDAAKAWEESTKRGAKSFLEPTRLEDEHGYIIKSGVYTWTDDIVHIFIEREHYDGLFSPGYDDYEDQNGYSPIPLGLKYIDHMVPNMDYDRLSAGVDYYRDIFGFHLFWELKVHAKYSSVDLEVMTNNNKRIKYNVIQPQVGIKKSFAEEFIEWYSGEGINHIALICDDIIAVIAELRSRGVNFLNVPDVYYETLLDRVGPIDEDLEQLRQQKILVDRDNHGYMLQIFLQPFGVRPVTYVEIIERKGARSFGNGNAKALMEALEREQEKRGTW